MSQQPQPRSKVSNSTLVLLVVLLAIAALLIGASGFGSIGAQNNPPGGPNPIVSQFRHPNNFISLGDGSFPAALTKQIDKALTALSADGDAAKYFDPVRAIYHFSADGKTLSIGAVPISGSRTASLGDKKITITTPDDKSIGQIIGSLYAPQLDKNALIIVYVSDSKQIRVYDTSGNQLKTPPTAVIATFAGVTGTSAAQAATQETTPTDSPGTQYAGKYPTWGDAGAIIAVHETCFTVGLNQICLQLNPQDDTAQKAAQSAVDNLSKTFKEVPNLKFDAAGAVSDVLGDDQRQACGKALIDYQFAGDPAPTACQPSAVWIALAGDPQTIDSFFDKNARVIGILSVMKNNQTAQGLNLDTVNNADGELYDGSDGGKTVKRIPALPAGDYLVLATDSSVSVGSVTAVYLAGSDGSKYLIPGLKIEAFGKPSDDKYPYQPWQAFDKDSGAGGIWMP